MSTKSTIHFNKNYHLYQEVFDDKNIYLTLDNFEDLKLNVTKATATGNILGNITIKIEKDQLLEIAEKYCAFYNNTLKKE